MLANMTWKFTPFIVLTLGEPRLEVVIESLLI